METRRVADTEHWSSCSDRFLKAAVCLPVEDPDMTLPRLELMVLALVCRLKAFIRAARGGTPGTDDLVRLTDLAVHCGLVLSREDYGRMVLLGRTPPDAAPSLAWVRAVCRSLDGQMSALPVSGGG